MTQDREDEMTGKDVEEDEEKFAKEWVQEDVRSESPCQ